MDISNIKVLVVDDEISVCSNIAAFLEDEGFTVFSVVSGEEALDLLLKQEIDVAIIDMRLPGIDGDALILKAHEVQPVLKFIIHTGSINYFISKTLEEIGVKNEQIFRKPLMDMSVLTQGILNLLEGKT
ncbi:MAG: response regulator [Smithella sp.]|jgi:DNA-binding NtrC family response regulator